MPQKRKTRNLNSKAKPKLPNSKTDNCDAKKEDERRNKLEVFLRDYDTKVESIKAKLEREYEKMLIFIEQKFNYELSRLPTNIREMTLEDYIYNVEEERKDEKRKDHSYKDPIKIIRWWAPRSLRDLMLSFVWRRVKPFRSQMIREERQIASTLTAPRTKSRQHMVAASPMVDNKFMTPCAGMSLAATGWGAPLITPKFDPRLPLTAAQKRPAQPGEIAMSLGGSPLEIPRTARVLHKRGRTLTIEADANTGMDEIEIPDDLSRTQITQVMKKLQDFLDKTKDD